MPIETDSIVIAGHDEKALMHLRLVAMGVSGAEIVGVATSPDALSALALGLEPDLIVLTSDFGDPNGLDTAMELKQASISATILVVNAVGQPEFVIVVDRNGIEKMVLGDT
jgi:DNA-binding NarL/FixJ family response regulator